MSEPLGIYVHIPFCSKRCDYCDFATWTDKSPLIETYFQAMVKQLAYQLLTVPSLRKRQLTSIFIGGGTPNYIDSSYISSLLSQLRNDFEITNDTEITIECNPDFISTKSLESYAQSGINRISMGVQSTDNEVLKFIGREHNQDHIHQAVEIIKKSGINNFNFDLIYGSAVESLESWEKTLRDVIAFNPNHISAYALGIEAGTKLGRDVKSGHKRSVDEDDIADKYLLADEILKTAEYSWYEISNWSKKGYESKHNQLYWQSKDILALGCSAHGLLEGYRYSTPRNIDLYIERFSTEISDDAFKDVWSDASEDIKNQTQFSLELRTSAGVSSEGITNTQVFEELISDQYIFLYNDKIVLTPKGRLMAHSISIDLYEAGKASRSN